MIAIKEQSKILSTLSFNEKCYLWDELSDITCVQFADKEDSIRCMNMAFRQMERIQPKAKDMEILHSYQLAANGTIEGKVFRTLDFAQMNEFFKSYIEYRSGIITQKNKEGKLYLDDIQRTHIPTEKEIFDSSIKWGYELVKSGGFYNPIGIEDLVYRNLFTKCEEEGREKWEDHTELAIETVKARKQSARATKEGRASFDLFMESLKSGNTSEVEDCARVIAINKMLNYYLKKRNEKNNA